MRKIEEHFGLAVRRRREQLGLSQEEFAETANVHRTYISSIELGKVQVSIAVAQRLADALGVRHSALWREIEQERDAPSGGRKS